MIAVVKSAQFQAWCRVVSHRSKEELSCREICYCRLRAPPGPLWLAPDGVLLLRPLRTAREAERERDGVHLRLRRLGPTHAADGIPPRRRRDDGGTAGLRQIRAADRDRVLRRVGEIVIYISRSYDGRRVFWFCGSSGVYSKSCHNDVLS